MSSVCGKIQVKCLLKGWAVGDCFGIPIGPALDVRGGSKRATVIHFWDNKTVLDLVGEWVGGGRED